jgi:hypothetical protein
MIHVINFKESSPRIFFWSDLSGLCGMKFGINNLAVTRVTVDDWGLLV